MVTSVLVLLGSVLFFLSWLLLLQAERDRSQRIVFIRLRGALDSVFEIVARRFVMIRLIVGKFTLQLGFRYLLHVVLRRVLLCTAGFYDRLMAYFESNRHQTKVIRKAKREWRESRGGHLAELQEHRRLFSLSDSEKKARKDAALEGK